MAEVEERGVEALQGPVPGGAQWKPISSNPVAVQGFGKYAVDEQNKMQGSSLKFNVVYAAWNMILDSESGKLYLLLIKALNVDIEDFEAIVWVRPRGYGQADCDRMTLISFKQISSEA